MAAAAEPASHPAETGNLAAAIQALMQEHADLRGYNANLTAQGEDAEHTTWPLTEN